MRWKGLLLLLGGLVFGTLIGLIIVRGGLTFSAPEKMPAPAEVGQPAPDFSLKNLEGETISLDQFRGKVVFLNFWATWCVPCREEMPLLQQFARENDGSAVVLGINLDEPAGQVASFTTDAGITFPILLDTGSEVVTRYAIRGYPTTVVVDSDGIIQAIHIGSLTQSTLADFLEQLIKND